MRFFIPKLVGLTAIASSIGCAWVKPTMDSHQVTLALTNAAVEQCQRKGSASVKTLSKIIIVPRSSDNVENELVSLAKNEASIMGGNTVLAESGIDGGAQRFGVYDCQR